MENMLWPTIGLFIAFILLILGGCYVAYKNFTNR